MKHDTRAKTALNASQGWINDESGEVIELHLCQPGAQAPQFGPGSFRKNSLVDNAC